MATLIKTFDSENDLTIFTAVGDVEAEQLANEVVSFLSGQPTRYVLWNITKGNLAGISISQLRMIVERGKPFADRRKEGKTAIVCSREVDFGISRIFQALTDIMQIPIAMEVFRSVDAAHQWLKAS